MPRDEWFRDKQKAIARRAAKEFATGERRSFDYLFEEIDPIGSPYYSHDGDSCAKNMPPSPKVVNRPGHLQAAKQKDQAVVKVASNSKPRLKTHKQRRMRKSERTVSTKWLDHVIRQQVEYVRRLHHLSTSTKSQVTANEKIREQLRSCWVHRLRKLKANYLEAIESLDWTCRILEANTSSTGSASSAKKRNG